MIKVNLLKNFDPSSNMQAAGGITYGEVSEASKATVLVKLVMLVIGPFVLNHFESEAINKKYRRVQAAQQQLVNIENQIAQVGDAVEIVSRYEKEKAKIEARIGVVKLLAQNRLREVTVMDELRKIIPERAWIAVLKVDNDQINLQGTAFTDDDIALFVDRIEESEHFADVIFTTNTAEKAESTNWKDYELTAQLEGI